MPKQNISSRQNPEPLAPEEQAQVERLKKMDTDWEAYRKANPERWELSTHPKLVAFREKMLAARRARGELV